VDRQAVDAHINDDAFVAAALADFDDWVAKGRIPAAGDRA